MEALINLIIERCPKEVYLPVLVGIVALIVILILVKTIVKIGKNGSDEVDLLRAIPSFMEDAEKHENYTGDDKLTYVLTKVLSLCVSSKISYNEEKIVDIVERLITFSKSVNKNKEERERGRIANGRAEAAERWRARTDAVRDRQGDQGVVREADQGAQGSVGETAEGAPAGNEGLSPRA